MSLAFDCPKCGTEIVVKYARPGEQALCRHCGERAVVPESARVIEADPDYMREEPVGRSAAWAEQVPAEVDVLASRLSRLAAAIIDSLVILAFAIPLMIIVVKRIPGLWEYPSSPDTWLAFLWIGLPSFLFYVGINSYPWATRGQSIGKMALRIQIVRIDDSPASWGRIVGLRILPITFIGYVPLLGNIVSLVDVLMIFRGSRRCLHDEIAGTKVVRATKAVPAT